MYIYIYVCIHYTIIDYIIELAKTKLKLARTGFLSLTKHLEFEPSRFF